MPHFSPSFSFQIDLNKMPLGKLSKKQIESAYKILTEAQVCHSWSRFVLFALSYGFPPFSYRDRVVFPLLCPFSIFVGLSWNSPPPFIALRAYVPKGQPGRKKMDGGGDFPSLTLSRIFIPSCDLEKVVGFYANSFPATFSRLSCSALTFIAPSLRRTW